MIHSLLLVGVCGALALALPHRRLVSPILLLTAALNLWVYGGTARYSLPDSANNGNLVAATMCLSCIGLGMYLLIPYRPSLVWIDGVAAALAATLPAGILALWLGEVLSGSNSPVVVHLSLLACCLCVAGLGMRAHGIWRGAALGMALCFALITLDSMRFGRMLHARTPAGGCLIFGDQTATYPLMALTVAKPVYWLGDGKWLRWSFRSRDFVSGSGPHTPQCPPP